MQTYDYIVTGLEKKYISVVESVNLHLWTLSVLEFGGQKRNLGMFKYYMQTQFNLGLYM